MSNRQQWQQPDGTTVTFEDRRPAAMIAAEQEEAKPTLRESITLPARIQPMIDFEKEIKATPGHEARHAVVGHLFEFSVKQARADIPEDGVLGSVAFDLDGEVWTDLRLAEMMVTLLAGCVGEKAGPPAWPLRLDDGTVGNGSDEKQLARMADALDLTESQYDTFVKIASDIVAHPGIKAAVSNLTVLMQEGLVLNERMITTTVEIGWDQPAAEQRHKAFQATVEQEKAIVLDYMAGYERYHREKELRRQCDQIAREFRAP